MTAVLNDPATTWIAIFAAAAGTIFWRVLGVALDGRIDPDGAVYQWISAVAYAMVAGLMVRVLILPSGLDDPTEMGLRALSLAAALAAWWFLGKSVMSGLAVGVGLFAACVFLILT